MATFYLRTSNYGATKKAASNASYILGEGKYADKDEISHTEANNLPDFAKNDPVAFFTAADNNERERSARGFVFAIPHEAEDRNRWASNFAKDLCGNAPYMTFPRFFVFQGANFMLPVFPAESCARVPEI